MSIDEPNARNPFVPPVRGSALARPNIDPSLSRQRAFAALGFHAAWFLTGSFALLGDAIAQLIAAIATASAAVMWCVVDSLLRRAYWPRSLQWISFMTWPLAVPGYLIWSRGRRGLLLAVGFGFSTLAMPIAGALAVEFAFSLL